MRASVTTPGPSLKEFLPKKKPKPDTVHVRFRIPREVYEELESIADENGWSMPKAIAAALSYFNAQIQKKS